MDQFEEIFTLGRRSDAAAGVAHFQAELESVIEHRAPDDIRDRLEGDDRDAARFDERQQAVRFVISLREDFLAHLTDWSKRMPSLLEYKLHLSDFTETKALSDRPPARRTGAPKRRLRRFEPPPHRERRGPDHHEALDRQPRRDHSDVLRARL
jgi:hypothetical protein